jgi:hypothetical protein
MSCFWWRRWGLSQAHQRSIQILYHAGYKMPIREAQFRVLWCLGDTTLRTRKHPGYLGMLPSLRLSSRRFKTLLYAWGLLALKTHSVWFKTISFCILLTCHLQAELALNSR